MALLRVSFRRVLYLVGALRLECCNSTMHFPVVPLSNSTEAEPDCPEHTDREHIITKPPGIRSDDEARPPAESERFVPTCSLEFHAFPERPYLTTSASGTHDNSESNL